MKRSKPKSSRCFKPGDMFIFTEGGLPPEVGVLIRRYDMHSKNQGRSSYPTWCWEMVLTPGERTPLLYNPKYGASEINLYNRIGADLKWIPAAVEKIS